MRGAGICIQVGGHKRHLCVCICVDRGARVYACVCICTGMVFMYVQVQGTRGHTRISLRDVPACACVRALYSLGDFRRETRTRLTHLTSTFLSQAPPGREVAQEPLTGTINLLFSPWGWSKMKLVFHFYTMRRSLSIFSLDSDCLH